jgi:arsenate reductase-like glutaredoxin family protein
VPRHLSIQIHPVALLLLPIAAFAVYGFIAYRPALSATQSESSLAHVESARTAAAPSGAEQPDSAHRVPVFDANGEPIEDQSSEPVESTAITTVNIAELERAREQAQRAEQQLDAARSRVKVTLYFSERCTRCIEARSHLLAQGIHPMVRDIDKDARARARHRALTRRGGLPTIEVDGKVLVGFQPERLDKAIARATTVRMQRKR